MRWAFLCLSLLSGASVFAEDGASAVSTSTPTAEAAAPGTVSAPAAVVSLSTPAAPAAPAVLVSVSAPAASAASVQVAGSRGTDVSTGAWKVELSTLSTVSAPFGRAGEKILTASVSVDSGALASASIPVSTAAASIAVSSAAAQVPVATSAPAVAAVPEVALSTPIAVSTAAFISTAAPTGQAFHIAAFRQTNFTVGMPILDPFERVLQQAGTGVLLLGIENLPSHFNGDDYMYRLPERTLPGARTELDLLPAATQVEVLETSGGFFLFVPGDPGLMGKFEALIRDRGSYEGAVVPKVVKRTAELSRSALADGSEIHSLRIHNPAAVRYPQWRSTMAVAYRLRYRGKEADAVFIFKTLGGEGRLAAALRSLRERYGDVLALNRGEIFVEGPSKTTGTLAGFRFEGMGVRAAVPGRGDLIRLKDMLAYRALRPEGLQFLCANLVYSTATARTLLPAYKVFEVQGKKIAVFGLTSPEFQRYLGPEHARLLTVKRPVEAAADLVPALRKKADVVVALTNLPVELNATLRDHVRGIDLIVGDSFGFQTDTALGSLAAEDPERGPYDEALLVSSDWPTVLTHLEVRHSAKEQGLYGLSAREEHILLDDSLADLDDYPKFDPATYGADIDTRPAVLPSARRLYADSKEKGYLWLKARDFWALSGALAADQAKAEAAFLPVASVLPQVPGDFKESLVREWFRYNDRLAVCELSGADLQPLVAEVLRQRRPGETVAPGAVEVEAAGLGPGGTIHGAGVDSRSVYRVVAAESLLSRTGQFPSLANARRVRPLGSLEGMVLGQLRRRAQEGWPPERYRPLLGGGPVADPGLWKVDFRDISVSVSNTKIVSDPAFSNVSNARVQGFDELLIGGVSKVDVDYYSGPYRFGNSLELEYSRSRLRPPDQPEIINIPKNRLWARSGATLRTSSFPWKWAAQSMGPSIGLEYDGQVERLPDQRRKNVVSLLPGVELYGGTLLRTVNVSGNFRRDFTPPSPLNNYGVRARAVMARGVGAGTLSGELWSNWFLRTRQDTSQDLRFELDATVKFSIPVLGHFSVAPFIDYYYSILKVRPVPAYSTIAGISVGFCRLWKPQYEAF